MGNRVTPACGGAKKCKGKRIQSVLGKKELGLFGGVFQLTEAHTAMVAGTSNTTGEGGEEKRDRKQKKKSCMTSQHIHNNQSLGPQTD